MDTGENSPSRNLITDLEEIRRLSKERLGENADFRIAIKQLLPWSNKKLNRTVEAMHDEVAAAIDCTVCGNCCRILRVLVSDTDIRRLARRAGISEAEFSSRHVERGEDRDLRLSSPCPFLDGNRCSVYEDRPAKCREYPFLKKDFRSRTIVAIGNAGICPIVFNVLERLKELIPWRQYRDRIDAMYPRDGGI